ncbi:solute carrier family 23 protein [Staphylococcus aureus]
MDHQVQHTGENIGVLAITRIYSIYVIGGAAVIAIVLAFIGKFTALIYYTYTSYGRSIYCFGIIAASGLILVESKVDFANNRNLVIASVILVVGMGHLVFNLKEIGINLQIEGMAWLRF